MRIAIITTYPPGKGSLNEYAFHFVRSLRAKPEVSEIILLVDELPSGQTYDLEPAGFGPETDTTARPSSAPVQVKPCWRFDDLTNPVRILTEVRRTKPDVVLFNIQFASFGSGKVAASLGLIAPAFVRMAGFPTVVLLHNIMETVDLKSAGFAANPLMDKIIRLSGQMVTRLLLQANLVALTIPKYVETLIEKYKADNVFLAPHGSFDETVSTPGFDLPPGPTQIMTFGKFGTYKRLETLIEAFHLLQATNGRNPIELVVAGSDSPNTPGYLDSMRRQFADVDGLRFTGYVAEEDVPRIFNEAAVVVFPYTSTTGSSGVLHQAGNYGKAVVLPNLGDFAELITEEGYTGEFFEPTCPKSLARAIANIIDNPQHRREIGTQNFMASRGILIDEVVDWYLLHFETLLN